MKNYNSIFKRFTAGLITFEQAVTGLQVVCNRTEQDAQETVRFWCEIDR